jgi:hypothetical protein
MSDDYRVENTLNMNICQYCMGAMGTVVSWFLVRRIVRSTLHVYGLYILFVLLTVVARKLHKPNVDQSSNLKCCGRN